MPSRVRSPTPAKTACAAEQSDLTAFRIGFEQVDHLDTGVEHFLHGGQFVEFRGFAVDRVSPFFVERLHAVDRIAHDVHQPPFDLLADRHGNRAEVRYRFHSPAQAVGAVHRDGAHGVFTDVLLYFDDQDFSVVAPDLHGVVDAGQNDLVFGAFERHVHHGADNLRNATCNLRRMGRVRYVFRFHNFFPIKKNISKVRS